MSLDVFFLPTGRPFFDLIFAGIPRWLEPGGEVYAEQFAVSIGGSFNIAYACRLLGLDVGLCAHLGNDPFSAAIRQRAGESGVSTGYFIEHNRPMASVTVSVSQQSDRGFLSYVDPIPDFDEADLPEHGTPHVVFIPGLPEITPALLTYLDRIKQAGSMLACDCNHVETNLDHERVRELIGRLDLFLCNDKEATALTGKSVPEAAAMKLGAYCPEVVVKLGRQGALALEGGLIHRESAIRTPVRDTTGAGDGFDGGYLYGLLEGMVTERRLRLGNVVGGSVAACLGGSTCELNIDQVFEIEKQNFS